MALPSPEFRARKSAGRPTGAVDLTFTHQFTPRLIVGFSSFTAYQSQPSFALGIGQTTNAGNYVFSSNSVSLGYEWTERFSTATSYTLNAVYYQASSAGGTQNRLKHIVAQQFRYSIFPTITASWPELISRLVRDCNSIFAQVPNSGQTSSREEAVQSTRTSNPRRLTRIDPPLTFSGTMFLIWSSLTLATPILRRCTGLD